MPLMNSLPNAPWKIGYCEYKDLETGEICGEKYERNIPMQKYCEKHKTKLMSKNNGFEMTEEKWREHQKEYDEEEIRVCNTKIYATKEYSPSEREKDYFIITNQDYLRQMLKLKEWQLKMESDLVKLSESPLAKEKWMGFN